jgi:dTDP-4-amino-4,6-dideoxygalactose transaminase
MSERVKAIGQARAEQTGRGSEPIPFLDLVAPHRALEDDLVAAFRRALHAAQFVGGPEVDAFEREFAAASGTAGCVGVNSGTDALRFACTALGVRPGDEVITVAHTFIATTEAITQAGGTIRFVDIDERTMTMDPALVEAAAGPRTVGIVPVHLYGHAADLDPILALARRRGLWVLEDAAQAHGATYRGRPVGALGSLGGFSFYPGKNLGSLGEGGAVVGADPALLAVVRQQREHGQSTKYVHETEGFNGRLHAIQAAFLRLKLPHLPAWNAARRRVAAWYRDALGAVGDVALPAEPAYGEHVYHLFVVRSARRDALRDHLAAQGIATGVHYPIPLHLQRAYARLGLRAGSLPVTERVAAGCLSLPMFPELSQSAVGRVADAIREFFDG